MDSHAETIEKQKERIRDLQTEREAAASAASTARDEVTSAALPICASTTCAVSSLELHMFSCPS